jgi:predicted DNA-binding protein with PD1-like motif
MKARQVSADGGRTFVLVFDPGDEVVEELTRWCSEHGVTAARFTGVGGFSDATVAWFDPEAHEYRPIPVTEQVELLSLNGDVAEQDGKPAPHAHAVLGRRDGSAAGGHLLAGHVRPTLELVVDEVPAHLRKRRDPQTGLALIALDAG